MHDILNIRFVESNFYDLELLENVLIYVLDHYNVTDNYIEECNFEFKITYQ